MNRLFCVFIYSRNGFFVYLRYVLLHNLVTNGDTRTWPKSIHTAGQWTGCPTTIRLHEFSDWTMKRQYLNGTPTIMLIVRVRRLEHFTTVPLRCSMSWLHPELARMADQSYGWPIQWVDWSRNLLLVSVFFFVANYFSYFNIILYLNIVQASKSNDPAIRQIADQSQGILFLGTPHRGSLVAKLRQHTQLIVAPTVEVKELVGNNSYLLELQAKFEAYLATRKQSMHIVSMSEGLPTKISAFNIPVKIVEEESSKIPVGDHYVLNVDHLCLSKPVVRHSFLYQRLLGMIDTIVPEEPRHLLPTLIRRHREDRE